MITIPPGLSDWEEIKYLLAKYNNLKQSTPTEYYTIANDHFGKGYLLYKCVIEHLESGLTRGSSKKITRSCRSLQEMKEFLIERLEKKK